MDRAGLETENSLAILVQLGEHGSFPGKKLLPACRLG